MHHPLSAGADGDQVPHLAVRDLYDAHDRRVRRHHDAHVAGAHLRDHHDGPRRVHLRRDRRQHGRAAREDGPSRDRVQGAIPPTLPPAPPSGSGRDVSPELEPLTELERFGAGADGGLGRLHAPGEPPAGPPLPHARVLRVRVLSGIPYESSPMRSFSHTKTLSHASSFICQPSRTPARTTHMRRCPGTTTRATFRRPSTSSPPPCAPRPAPPPPPLPPPPSARRAGPRPPSENRPPERVPCKWRKMV